MTTGDKAELRELFDKTGATYSFLNDQRVMTFEQFVAAYNTRAPSPPSEVVERVAEQIADRILIDANDRDYEIVRNELVDFAGSLQAADVSGVPEGWKLVPVEPTFDMKQKGAAAINAEHRKQVYAEPVAEAGYKAMLAAAPER